MVQSKFILALVCSLGLSTAAIADNTKATLISFGLLGVWAADCAKDQTKESFVARTTYAVSGDGAFETVSMSMGNGEIVSWRKAIKSARIVDGKMELVTAEIST